MTGVTKQGIVDKNVTPKNHPKPKSEVIFLADEPEGEGSAKWGDCSHWGHKWGCPFPPPLLCSHAARQQHISLSSPLSMTHSSIIRCATFQWCFFKLQAPEGKNSNSLSKYGHFHNNFTKHTLAFVVKDQIKFLGSIQSTTSITPRG